MALERRAFVLRKRVEHAVDGLYFPSLSARTLVYKGMLTSEQLRQFFTDLRDPRFESGLALVHSALLDQHLPELAPGPPVPLHGPQRGDQHPGRQPQLDAGPGGPPLHRPHRGGPVPYLPGLHAGGERLGLLRRGARAPPPGRALAAPRRAHDDPRGVGEPRHDGRGPAGLLPLPRLAHGALGRAGRRDLHRRHRRRGRPRPQRPAPRSILGHRRRPRRPGQRGRRPRHRPRAGRAQGAPPARPHVPGRHGQGPPGRGRGDQVRAGRPAPLRRLAGHATRSAWTSYRSAPCSRRSTGGSSPSSACSATRPRSCASSWPRWPGPAASRSAPWARTPPSPCCRTAPARSTTTSPSSSPR